MFVERVGDDALAPLAAAGDFPYVDPDESASHGRIMAVRADGPGSATRVRRMAVGSALSIPRAAAPAGETMMRAVAVFVGPAVRGATPRHYRPAAGSGRNRLPRHVAKCGDPVVTVR